MHIDVCMTRTSGRTFRLLARNTHHVRDLSESGGVRIKEKTPLDESDGMSQKVTH
jgi:hypothetical protein